MSKRHKFYFIYRLGRHLILTLQSYIQSDTTTHTVNIHMTLVKIITVKFQQEGHIFCVQVNQYPVALNIAIMTIKYLKLHIKT